MTEVLRPSIYGAQHPIVHFGKGNSADKSTVCSNGNSDNSYVVVGHCCESGDLFTCAPSEPETLKSRPLISPSSPSKCIEIGDLVSIEGAGAYCSSMSTKNYNSFPEAPEVMIDTNGKFHVIRRKQTLDQIIENEIPFRKVGSK
jgi:diaminopimelate decarboxylase